MKNNYVCLNTKTFEIEDKFVSVESQLVNAISILTKKGYCVEVCNKAKISKPFLINSFIHELNQQGIIDTTTQTKDKLIKIIKQLDYETTLIVFKENYQFEQLPKGYELNGKNLIYNLTCLKNDNDIELKSLLDLDKELQESIKDLEKWAEQLPNIVF